jgi:hypothetical protein
MQREQGYEDPWLYLEAKRVLRTESFGNTGQKDVKQFTILIALESHFLSHRCQTDGKAGKNLSLCVIHGRY